VGRRCHRPLRQALRPGGGGRIRGHRRAGRDRPAAGIWLSVGVDERDDQDSTIYNSLLHFAPDGSLAGRHRKLMPTGGERLVWGMGDGSTLKVIDTAFGRLGGLICWENYMPLEPALAASSSTRPATTAAATSFA
jgi:predicted amidohydrolase